MAIIVTNEITVPSARIDDVAAKFAANGEKIKGLDGFEGFDVLSPTNPADDRVLVITRWRDEDAYKTWRTSEHFAAGHPGVRPGDGDKELEGQPHGQGHGRMNSVVRHYDVKVTVTPAE